MRTGNRYFRGVLASAAALLYLSSGLYSLENGQHAIILRFGRVVDHVTESGIHYRLPLPIEKAVKIDARKVQRMAVHDESVLYSDRITGDENLVVVRAMVSYDIVRPSDYHFSTCQAEALIKTTAQYCLSGELAGLNVDKAMTTGKSIMQTSLKRQIQEILDRLETGVHVITVELTDISPPLPVSASFVAVSGARVKKQEIIKNAEGYANARIPAARGEAAAVVRRAEAEAREMITLARGRAASFERLLAEYRRNPSVTLRQKYLETIRAIAGQATISLDSNTSQAILYLHGKQDPPSRAVSGEAPAIRE